MTVARERADSELATMKGEYEVIRKKMDTLVNSIPWVLETRSREATEDRAFRDTVREEFKERYQDMLSSTSESADSRVDNLKAQSEQFLRQREAAVRAVRAQLDDERKAHRKEVCSNARSCSFFCTHAGQIPF